MIFDTDAHVEESEEIFASLQGREEFAQSAPRVIEGHNRGFWLIEGRTFPKLNGKGVNTFGSPHLAGRLATSIRSAGRAWRARR
jgi:hypothetical protein